MSAPTGNDNQILLLPHGPFFRSPLSIPTPYHFSLLKAKVPDAVWWILHDPSLPQPVKGS